VATESMYSMKDHAMTDICYRRIQWLCNALNAELLPGLGSVTKVISIGI